MRYLLDTDTCSLAIKGNPNVLLKMQQARGDWCISAVTFQELAMWLLDSKGARHEASVEQFIRMVEVIDFTSSDALATAEISTANKRNGHNIGHADNQIAAHAANCGLTLVTNNLKHFKPIAGLSSETWA